MTLGTRIRLNAGWSAKTLDELWTEFQKTTAFTPVAAEVNKLYNALGYLNGKPPRDVRIRFKAYLKQQPQTNDLLEADRSRRARHRGVSRSVKME